MAPAPPPDELGPDDDDLVARARSGDREAFGELVRRHQRAALRVAAVITGSTEEAPDVVQDAMVRASGRLGSYRGDGTVRSWLLRVVANEAKNHVRSRTRRRNRYDRHATLQLRADRPADELALDRSDHAALAAAFGRLRPDDRAVLGCRYVADLGEAETAAVLDLPRGTVKSRTARALERLRAELGVGESDTATGGWR